MLCRGSTGDCMACSIPAVGREAVEPGVKTELCWGDGTMRSRSGSCPGKGGRREWEEDRNLQGGLGEDKVSPMMPSSRDLPPTPPRLQHHQRELPW